MAGYAYWAPTEKPAEKRNAKRKHGPEGSCDPSDHRQNPHNKDAHARIETAEVHWRGPEFRKESLTSTDKCTNMAKIPLRGAEDS